MDSNEGLVPRNAPNRVEPPLFPGDPAPWFRAASDVAPQFEFSTLGGRRLIVTFVDSMTRPEGKVVVDGLMAGTRRLVASTTGLVIISADPADMAAKVPDDIQCVRFLFDPDGAVGKLYGVAGGDGGCWATTFILDERLRVLAVIPVQDAAAHATIVAHRFERIAPLPEARRARTQAPVLMVPSVFEPAFCRTLIAEHESHGGAESGFMVERDGLTIEERDPLLKQRTDWTLTDQRLIDACRARIRRRIVPEIQRVFQFTVTRIERYLVACYDAEEGGVFAPHRDNSTRGTAHRRFAVSINLNNDYEGGNLLFPEFGRAHFLPPAGGACVFSCSLLHEATKVTRGKRYVFVPFLYDEAAKDIRDQNLSSLKARD